MPLKRKEVLKGDAALDALQNNAISGCIYHLRQYARRVTGKGGKSTEKFYKRARIGNGTKSYSIKCGSIKPKIFSSGSKRGATYKMYSNIIKENATFTRHMLEYLARLHHLLINYLEVKYVVLYHISNQNLPLARI